MTTVVLDTHVIQWWSVEPGRMSPAASQAVLGTDELAVSAISWFELAWLARHERILVTVPLRSWLEDLSGQVRTIGVTPAIAATAVSLPSSFPGDTADRLVYATALECGGRLITKDLPLRTHRHPQAPVLR
ncbi:MAG: type II toxin-antitoxin system VapC family toxin [Candidatus Dormibacteria bacterium]